MCLAHCETLGFVDVTAAASSEILVSVSDSDYVNENKLWTRSLA